jgi:hypothetical protein
MSSRLRGVKTCSPRSGNRFIAPCGRLGDGLRIPVVNLLGDLSFAGVILLEKVPNTGLGEQFREAQGAPVQSCRRTNCGPSAKTMRNILNEVSLQECSNYFADAGKGPM